LIVLQRQEEVLAFVGSRCSVDANRWVLNAQTSY
jgi:hypothetical protein